MSRRLPPGELTASSIASTFLLAILLLSGPGAAAAAVAAERSPGCGLAPPGEPGATVVLSMEFGGLAREYRLHLPPSYQADQPLSLLLHFHGYTGSAEHSEKEWTRLSPHADGNGYVVVFPQSTSFTVLGPNGEGRSITSWNDGACNASPGPAGPTCAADSRPYPCAPECGDCGACNWCSCHDDVGFVAAVLDKLESTLCIDRNRVFASGFSNGGMFVHALGCALPDRFTAVAPLHGTLARGFDCAPSAPVSLLLVAGRTDRTVPLDGSRASDGYFYTAIDEVATSWAKAQRCTAARG